MSVNLIMALELLIRFTESAQKIGKLIAQAQAENRDITPEELTQLKFEDDIVRSKLQALIGSQV